MRITYYVDMLPSVAVKLFPIIELHSVCSLTSYNGVILCAYTCIFRLLCMAYMYNYTPSIDQLVMRSLLLLIIVDSYKLFLCYVARAYSYCYNANVLDAVYVY